MQFIRTLFWVVIAAFLSIIASHNWRDVTIDLWSDLQADIKLPVLMAAMFLLGFLPPYLILRSKLWRLRRRLVNAERRSLELQAASAPPAEAELAEPGLEAP